MNASYRFPNPISVCPRNEAHPDLVLTVTPASRRVPTFEMDQVASKLSNASISGNTNGASATGTEDEDEDEDEEVEEEEDDL